MREFTLQFDFVNRLLFAEFSGAATEDTILEAFDAIRKFVSENGPCNIVRDYSKSKGITSSAFVEKLGSLPPLVPVGLKHVIIVAHPVQYGVVRQLQALRAAVDGSNYHVVHSREEAWQILGITSPKLSPVDF